MKFLPYICLGDPTKPFTLKLAQTLVQNGADALELGIPFSDPVADGPTIQKAAFRSIENGFKRKDVFSLIRKIKKLTNVPLTIMTYYNIVYSFGLEKFVKNIKNSGADNILCPDLPLEESSSLSNIASKYNLNLIHMVSPNSTEDRIKKICKASSSFIYLVSTSGVTGARTSISFVLKNQIKLIKKYSNIPVYVGFGISNKNQLKFLESIGADGFIIGSKIIDLYEKGGIEEVKSFVSDLTSKN